MSNEVKLIITTDAEQAKGLLKQFGDDATVMGDKAAKGAEAGQGGFRMLGLASAKLGEQLGIPFQATHVLGTKVADLAKNTFPAWGMALGTASIAIAADVIITQQLIERKQKLREELDKQIAALTAITDGLYKNTQQSDRLTRALYDQAQAGRVVLQIKLKELYQDQYEQLKKLNAEVEKGPGTWKTFGMAFGSVLSAIGNGTSGVDEFYKSLHKLTETGPANVRKMATDLEVTAARIADLNRNVTIGNYSGSDQTLAKQRAGLIAYRAWVIELQDEQKKIDAEARVKEWGDTEEWLGRRTALVMQHKQNEINFEATYTSALVELSQTRGDTIEEQQQREIAAFDAAAAAKYSSLKTLDEQQEFLTKNNIARETLQAKHGIQTDEMRWASAQSTTGNMSQAFALMYKLGGENARKYFETYKIASAAETIISTARGAMKAIGQDGWVGYVEAAAIIAMGAAQLASIQAQSFNGGGGAVGTYSANPATGMPESAVYSADYGTGWRPGEGQDRMRGGDTYITIQGNIYPHDSTEFKQVINEAVQQNIADGGNTRTTIRKYV